MSLAGQSDAPTNFWKKSGVSRNFNDVTRVTSWCARRHGGNREVPPRRGPLARFYDLGCCVPPCYKSEMKTTERWLLFKYVGTDLTPLSKPFKTKELAEKARLKFSERERRAIGLGVIRTAG